MKTRHAQEQIELRRMGQPPVWVPADADRKRGAAWGVPNYVEKITGPLYRGVTLSGARRAAQEGLLVLVEAYDGTEHNQAVFTLNQDEAEDYARMNAEEHRRLPGMIVMDPTDYEPGFYQDVLDDAFYPAGIVPPSRLSLLKMA